MKIEVNVKQATKDLTKITKGLSSDQVSQSIARAINSTLLKVRSEASREVRARYNIGTTEFNKGTEITKSTYSMLRGQITADNRTLQMKTFNPVEIRDSVKISRAGGKKGSYAAQSIRKSTFEGVMIEILKGKKKVIKSASMLLTDKSNGVIKARGKYSGGFGFDTTEKRRTLKAPSIYAMLNTTIKTDDLSKFTMTQYVDILEKELKKRIKGIK